MSKTYETYDTVPILERLPLQIEAVAAYDDYLLVGTRQGHLLMYSIQQGSTVGGPRCEVQLLRSNKYFSKKPVVQLDVVPEHQILISLSDNLVSVHDVSVVNFPFITSVQKSRGATYFALDVQRQVSLTGEIAVMVRLCVVVKRKLQLYYWKNRDFHDFVGPDLSVPDIPRSLVWRKETLCIGFKGEYCLLKLSGEQKDLFPTGKQPEPLMCSFQEDKFALCRDEQTILVDSEGNPSKKYVVSWSETPSFIAEDFPFIVGILPSYLEVRAMEPKILIQKIECPKARLLCKAQNRRGLIYVSSPTHVWCLQLVPVHQQVAPLLADKHFQLAIQLANMSEEAEDIRRDQVQHIQSLYAFDLFRNKRFEDAFQLFFELRTDPAYVIGLFPDLLPDVYRKQLEYPEEPVSLQPRELEQALLSLIKFLTEVRNSLISQNSRVNPAPDVNTGTKTRRQLLQIVDTSLLKCYLLTNDALVASLLRLRDNHCHLKESEQALRKHHKHAELIILYQTRGLHKEALELLKKHATTMENSGSPLSHHDNTVKYLQHLGAEHIDLIFEFSDWVLAFHPEDGLKIFTEDIHEVEELPRAKVYDFLSKTHPHLGLPYLEHVVFEWKDTNALFHNALALQYKNRILELRSSQTPGQHGDNLKESSQKLKKFLLESEHYTAEAILVQFPFDDFFEERAILLGRLGRHEQALSIYVHILQDIAAALQYCQRSYRSSGQASDVYFHLLKLLLQPWAVAQVPGLVYSKPIPNVPDTDTALDLLDRYAAKIDPMKVLEILPSNIQLKRLRIFLKRCMEASAAEKRKLQLVRGLLYSEHLQVHGQRIEKQNEKIVMTESNICYVCKKRFGNQSAFVRCANGEIVHYSCQEKRTLT